MSAPETSHVPADRERQLAEVVGLIMETSLMDTLLDSYRYGLDIPELQSIPRSYELMPLPPDFERTQQTEIKQNRDRINRDLRRLGGIPCRYTDRDTRGVITSTFIAWHGPLQSNPGLHLWSPGHRPFHPVTVEASYLDALRARYPGESEAA